MIRQGVWEVGMKREEEDLETSFSQLHGLLLILAPP